MILNKSEHTGIPDDGSAPKILPAPPRATAQVQALLPPERAPISPQPDPAPARDSPPSQRDHLRRSTPLGPTYRKRTPERAREHAGEMPGSMLPGRRDAGRTHPPEPARILPASEVLTDLLCAPDAQDSIGEAHCDVLVNKEQAQDPRMGAGMKCLFELPKPKVLLEPRPPGPEMGTKNESQAFPLLFSPQFPPEIDLKAFPSSLEESAMTVRAEHAACGGRGGAGNGAQIGQCARLPRPHRSPRGSWTPPATSRVVNFAPER